MTPTENPLRVRTFSSNGHYNRADCYSLNLRFGTLYRNWRYYYRLKVMNADSLNIASRNSLRRRHWLAWIGLCGALAMHVADEALTDFLALYNPAVLAIRERQPWLPLPTFTFETWLALLIFAVVALVAASYFVWRGRWANRPK